MIVLKVLAIIAIVLVVLFLLTLVIYFFNLDMKFAAALIKPLTAYYNWSKNRREAKKKKESRSLISLRMLLNTMWSI